MTVTSEAAAATSSPQQRLELADGLDLVGEFQASGYKEAPCIVRLASGQTIQLTPLLFDVLSCIDGQRDLEGVAAAVSERINKTASADDIAFLVDNKLRPLGVLKLPDGSNPEVKKSDPLLGIKGRFTLANERVTNTVTAPFKPLFLSPVVVAFIAGFVAALWWLFFDEGLANGTRQLLYSPSMLVLTFALTVASAGFHEFGHAAACKYGGARPGKIGGGIYLVWPVFFTDVTDSYRLSRAARLRTDLGGIYFNILFSLGTLGVWTLTHYDPLLILIPLQLMQMTHQLMPFVRFDGYYILADLTGVPDLFARIKPTLQAAIPGHEARESVKALKPWVRVAVTVWVLAVVPIILVSVTLAVIGLPRLLATVADSVARQWHGLEAAWGVGSPMRVIAGGLATIAVALPAFSAVYMMLRMSRRIARAAWKRTDGRPAARVALGPLALAAVAGLAWLWWPNGEYKPLHKGEKWTVQETVSNIREVPTGRPGLTKERAAEVEPEPTTSTTAPQSTTSTTVDRDRDTNSGGGRVQVPDSGSADSEPDTTTTTVDNTDSQTQTTETTSP